MDLSKLPPIDYGMRIQYTPHAYWDTDYVANIAKRFRIVTPSAMVIISLNSFSHY